MWTFFHKMLFSKQIYMGNHVGDHVQCVDEDPMSQLILHTGIFRWASIVCTKHVNSEIQSSWCRWRIFSFAQYHSHFQIITQRLTLIINVCPMTQAYYYLVPTFKLIIFLVYSLLHGLWFITLFTCLSSSGLSGFFKILPFFSCISAWISHLVLSCFALDQITFIY